MSVSECTLIMVCCFCTHIIVGSSDMSEIWSYQCDRSGSTLSLCPDPTMSGCRDTRPLPALDQSPLKIQLNATSLLPEFQNQLYYTVFITTRMATIKP